MTDLAVVGTLRLADVFGKTFRILGRRFVPFVALALIAQIPAVLIAYVTLAIGASGDQNAGKAAGSLLQVVLWPIANGAITYGVIRDLQKKSFSIGDAIRVAAGRLWPMVGVAIWGGILIGVGFIALVVPGVMLACRYYVSIPACIAERTTVTESLSRSAFLTAGHRWQVFGIGTLVYACMIAILLVAGLVAGLTGVPVAPRGGTDVAFELLTQVISAIVMSVNGVIAAVFYYQLRVAKEGVDIDQIASVFD